MLTIFAILLKLLGLMVWVVQAGYSATQGMNYVYKSSLFSNLSPSLDYIVTNLFTLYILLFFFHNMTYRLID